MQCGDLDRHLESFLDGQLDRSDSGALRRHLALCGACQARVERLRQFERDTQRRFRALDRTGSVWQGLELDLVASSRAIAVSRLLALPRPLPPPRRGGYAERPSSTRRAPRHPALPVRPNGHGRASRVVGILLLAMALGAIYQLGRAYLQSSDELAAAAAAYRQYLQDGQAPAVRGADAQQLRAWLAAELGLDVPIPPAPVGYHLMGVDRAAFAAGEVGVLVYEDLSADTGTPVLLFVRPLTGEPPERPAATVADEGLHELSWAAASVHYTLVGHESAEALRQFVH